MNIVPKALPLWRPHNYRYVHTSGGRAGGKTKAIAQRMVGHMLEEPGVRCLAVRHIEKSADQSIKYEMEVVIDENGWRPRFEKRMRDVIRCRNGSEAMFLGLQSDPSSVKGFSAVKYAWVEEGEEISPLEWGFFNPTIRVPGARIYISMNPTREGDVLWREFFETEDWPAPALAEQTLFLDFSWRDLSGEGGSPKLLPDELLRVIRREYETDPEMAAHRWGGDLQVRTDALVFRRGRHWDLGTVGRAGGGVEKVEVPPSARKCYGLDYSGVHSPAVGVRCSVWPGRVHVEAEALRPRANDRDLRELLDAILDRPGAEVFTDHNMRLSAGRSRAGGYTVTLSRKGNDSVDVGVRWLRDRKVTVEPSCRRVVRELSSWSYKIDRSTGEVAIPEKFRQDGKDSLDALRYAVEREIWSLRGARETGAIPLAVLRGGEVAGRSARRVPDLRKIMG